MGDDRLSQIASAVAAEIAAGADLGPKLLGRVSSAARPAECHRMVRTHREEQRSESNEHQHDARIVFSKHEPVKPGSEIVWWKVWMLVDNRATSPDIWLLAEPLDESVPVVVQRQRHRHGSGGEQDHL